MTQPSPPPPPGWYPDARGQMHWWDGTAWAQVNAPAGTRSGLAVAALVVGVGAFVLGWLPIVGTIIGAAGIVLAVIALRKQQPKVPAITGLVLAALAVLTSVAITVVAFTTGPWDAMEDPSSQSQESEPVDPAPEEVPEPSASQPVEPAAPAKSEAQIRDELMIADGWEVYESGNLYVQFADPSEFTCGYSNCTFVHVATVKGCANTLYVEASLMKGDSVIGMANDLLGVVGPEGTATAHLEDHAGNADGYRLTKVNCY